MVKNPTVDRKSFQKLLASAFVVQQSQENGQSRSVIVQLRRSITNGELAADGSMQLQRVVNANAVAVGPSFGAQVPLLELEEDRSSVDFLSPLASVLAAYDTGNVSTETALEPGLNDTAEIAELARLINVSCVVECSTPPPADEQPNAVDRMNTCFAAPRFRTPEVKAVRLQSRDPWTPLLGIMAIGLAFLLAGCSAKLRCSRLLNQSARHSESPPVRMQALRNPKWPAKPTGVLRHYSRQTPGITKHRETVLAPSIDP